MVMMHNAQRKRNGERRTLHHSHADHTVRRALVAGGLAERDARSGKSRPGSEVKHKLIILNRKYKVYIPHVVQQRSEKQIRHSHLDTPY